MYTMDFLSEINNLIFIISVRKLYGFYPERLFDSFTFFFVQSYSTTNTVQIRYKYGTHMVQIRYKYGTNTVQIRYKYGTNTVQIRYKYGTNTVQIRC